MIRNLQTRLQQADEILAQAQADGMEVAAAIAQQTEARQNLIKARSEVHTFAVDAMAAPVKTGLALAATDYRAGQNALHERNVRREGLGFSLVGIGITVLGLWLAIRRLGGDAAGPDRGKS